MNVVMYPNEITFYNDQVFNIDPDYIHNRDNCRYPDFYLRERLKAAGVEMHTPDYYKGSFKGCDKLLMFNFDGGMAQEMSFLDKKDRILFLVEPPVVRPDMWSKQMLKNFAGYFGRVYTWADELVDNVHFFKFNLPQVPPKDGWPENKDFQNSGKYLLALISSNYGNDFPGELYTLRREMAKHCDMKVQDFHLYGGGWDGLRSSMGGCRHKFPVLRDHKFSICTENSFVGGYITEKIFDSFFSGCIPVYCGAPNIKDYIPSDTFIDIRDFAGIDLLVNYLRDMDEKTLNNYRRNTYSFLTSDRFIPFSLDHYVRIVAQALEIDIGLVKQQE